MFRKGGARGSSPTGTAQAAQPWDHLLSPNELPLMASKQKLCHGNRMLPLPAHSPKEKCWKKAPTCQVRENWLAQSFLQDTHALPNPVHGYLDRLVPDYVEQSSLLQCPSHSPLPSLAVSPKRMGAVRLPSRAVPTSSSSSHAQSCPRTHPGPFTSAHCLPAQAAIPFTNTGSHQLLPPPRKRCSL